jgi:hypothetical protein
LPCYANNCRANEIFAILAKYAPCYDVFARLRVMMQIFHKEANFTLGKCAFLAKYLPNGLTRAARSFLVCLRENEIFAFLAKYSPPYNLFARELNLRFLSKIFATL